MELSFSFSIGFLCLQRHLKISRKRYMVVNLLKKMNGEKLTDENFDH